MHTTAERAPGVVLDHARGAGGVAPVVPVAPQAGGGAGGGAGPHHPHGAALHVPRLRGGIFPRRTNKTQEAWVYSHDGPIGVYRHDLGARRKCALPWGVLSASLPLLAQEDP
eukprot:5555873-Pyramimonas_sp.AAC.1